MSGHSLPDNFNDWPRDPYRLLGVQRGSDAREIRRAYLHLIRQFKPDSFPEQFQQIRGAYETIAGAGVPFRAHEQRLPAADRTRRPARVPIPLVNTDQARSLVSLASSHEQPAADEETPRQRPRDPVAQMTSAWQLALSGQPEHAYRQLETLHAVPEIAGDACLRLYWLLAAMPELSSSHVRCDWLAEALYHDRLRGPAMELFHRELHNDPHEALSERYAPLLQVPTQPRDLLRLLEARWRAFTYLNQPDGILEDLQRSRGQMDDTDGEIWACLLLLAWEQLVWFQDSEAVRSAVTSFQTELEELSTLHLSLHDLLVQLDKTAAIAAGWEQIRQDNRVPPYLSDFLPFSCTQTDQVVQAELSGVLERIASRTATALEVFDRIRDLSPAVLHHLITLIRNTSDSHEPDTSGLADDDLQMLGRRFQATYRGEYSDHRHVILVFCLQEGISPEEIGPSFSRFDLRPGNLLASWSSSLKEDIPLQCVFAACRRFMSSIAND